MTGKLGCISPSVVNLPWDLAAVLPAGVAAMVTTLNVRNGQPGEFERAVATMGAAVDVLLDEGATAIAVFGVPISARRGYAAERAALAALTSARGAGSARGAAPITSTLAAVCAAFATDGVRRPLLVTQYADDVNAAIATFFADAGLAPCGAAGLGARDAAAVNRTTPADYAALARRALAAHPAADGVFLAARGNLAAVAADIQREAGVPAVEQVGAAVRWACARFNPVATV